MSIKALLVLLWVVWFSLPAEAFFRLLCFNPLGFGRIDPIVSPGKPSGHLHHLHGSGNLGIDSVDAAYLNSANCTSCSVTVDKSSYWAPAMYFQHDNGTFELMSTSGSITIYYKTEKRTNFEDQNYTAFPSGFRMVAGNVERRSWVGPWPVPAQSFWGPEDTAQSALATKALGFNCLNYTRNWNEATFAYPWLREKSFIDANCGDGIRAEVLFPSCWDGVNLDSADHKSHVAYPTLLQDGACPQSHPVYLPILFYETIWNTQDFAGKPGQFVFSNGDPTGYGYHADFFAAWNTGVLEQVMTNPVCTDQVLTDRHSDGLQEHCPVFAAQIQSADEAALCKLQDPPQLEHEKINYLFDTLPGNVKVTGIRHDPGTEPEDTSGTSSSPSAASSVQVKPSSSSVVSSSSSGGIVMSSTPTISPTAQNNTVISSDFPIVSTSTFISNGVYYEIDVVMTMVTAYVTTIPSATVTTTVQRKRHVHGHKHREIV